MTLLPRLVLLVALAASASAQTSAPVPIPEHPRPDFERAAWVNLNGTWRFQGDAADAGLGAGWHARGLPASQPITVPFPWGSPLSGVWMVSSGTVRPMTAVAVCRASGTAPGAR